MRQALIHALLVATASAGELVEWPEKTRAEWESIPVAKLPAEVRPQDLEDPERPLTTVAVRRLDADGDGVADIIVDTKRGGTGGSSVLIYRRDGKRYRKVLAEQGGIFMSSKRGCVECWSRVGGMQYRRAAYRFDGRRFVELFMDSLRERHRDDRLEVVERRKPAPSKFEINGSHK